MDNNSDVMDAMLSEAVRNKTDLALPNMSQEEMETSIQKGGKTSLTKNTSKTGAASAVGSCQTKPDQTPLAKGNKRSKKKTTNTSKTGAASAVGSGRTKGGKTESIRLEDLNHKVSQLTEIMNSFAPVVTELKTAYDAARQHDEVSDSDDEVTEHTESNSSTVTSKDSAGNEASEGLLDDLMQEVNENEQTGKALTEKMSSVLDNILATGLSEQALTKRKEKIKRPENCKLLRVTKVNSEIWEIAQKPTRSMDACLQKLQEALIKGLIPMARVAGLVGDALSKKADMPMTLEELWEGLSNSVLLVASANHDLNMCRRDLFKADLDEKYKAICSNKEPVAVELFGDDLGERLKTVKESKKAAQQLTGHKRKWEEQSPRGPRGPNSYRGNFLSHGRGRPYQGRPQRKYNPQYKYSNTYNRTSVAKGPKPAKQK